MENYEVLNIEEDHSFKETFISFIRNFEPCSAGKETDQYSTKELNKMIGDHTGNYDNLLKISRYMRKLGYSDELRGKDLIWLVKKKPKQ